MELPNAATLTHFADRLKANDIAWFKDRFQAGDLAWLTDRLPGEGYAKLGNKIEAGDLAYVRTVFRGLDIDALSGPVGTRTTSAGTAESAGGVVINDERSKSGAVWLLPVGLVLALLLGFGLSRLGEDPTPTVRTPTDTAAVVESSVAP